MIRGPAAVAAALATAVLAALGGRTPAAQAATAEVVAPEVTAEGAVLYDPADDRVLHGVAPDVPRPMASTTKIMTALVALEAGTIDNLVTVSEEAAATGRTPGAATLGLVGGQQLAMRSLLAGLVLRSGNDAAVAVAEHVAGDQAAFVARMNARAGELGLTATHFVNPSGLTDDATHVSSPLDLARLAQVAMANPDFAGWAGAVSLTVPGLAPLANRNELLRAFPGATGVKTGYTNLAGLCLVASASREGRELFAVVLDSEASFTDAALLLEYGFSAFRRANPAAPGSVVGEYRWPQAVATVVPAEPLAATVGVTQAVTWEVSLDPEFPRPAPAGAVVGQAQLRVADAVVDAVDLVTSAPVPAPAQVSPARRAGAAVHEALRAFTRLEPVSRAA